MDKFICAALVYENKMLVGEYHEAIRDMIKLQHGAHEEIHEKCSGFFDEGWSFVHKIPEMAYCEKERRNLTFACYVPRGDLDLKLGQRYAEEWNEQGKTVARRKFTPFQEMRRMLNQSGCQVERDLVE